MATLDYLTRLISFNTTSSDKAHFDRPNSELIEYMAGHFRQCAFTTLVYEVAPGKLNLLALSPSICSPSASQCGGAGRHGGSAAEAGQDLGLLLSGHSDCVPFDDEKWTDSALKLTVRDGRAYGRGACDMKGFLACSMEAAAAAHARYGDDFMSYPRLSCLITCDEESSMNGAIDAMRLIRDDLNEQNFTNLKFSSASMSSLPADLLRGRHFDLIIIGEATSMQAVIGHKGYMARDLMIKGVSAHSSNPALGINAINIASHAITALNGLAQELQVIGADSNFKVGYPSMNMGYMNGGHSINSICDEAHIGFDIRPTPKLSEAVIIQKLDEVLAGVNAKANELYAHQLTTERVRKRLGLDAARKESETVQLLTLTLPFADIPSFANTNENSLGYIKKHVPADTVFEYVNYCTEASFLQHLGPTVVMGPGSIDQAHGIDEYIELSQLQLCDDFLAAIAAEF